MSSNSIVSGTISEQRMVSAICSSRSSGTWTMATFGSTVVNGYSPVSAPAAVRALNSVDLPALGMPTIPIFTSAPSGDMNQEMTRPRRRQSSDAGSPITLFGRPRTQNGGDLGPSSPARCSRTGHLQWDDQAEGRAEHDTCEDVGRVVHAEVWAADGGHPRGGRGPLLSARSASSRSRRRTRRWRAPRES